MSMNQDDTLYVDCETDEMERLGDGVCDIQNYNDSCGYDGGDCNVIHFRKDAYVKITPESLGPFFLGQGRSELSFYFAGIGNQDSFIVDETSNWGYLFDRSVKVDDRYWYGLWAYVKKSGRVFVGWYEDEDTGEAHEFDCGVVLTDPKSKEPRFVQYIFDEEKTFSLYVDGESKCSLTIDEPNIFEAERAPMILGRDNGNNLNMDLIDIQLQYENQSGGLSPTSMAMTYVASWSNNDCFVDEMERLGDGVCDIQNYKASCGYDGGDCSAFHFRRDDYINVTSESLGQFFFGQSRSELSFYFAGIGEVDESTDYGYHFDRSILVDNRYWYGLWAYVYDYGRVKIGWFADDESNEYREMDCGIILPDPISKEPRFLQYIFDDMTLSLHVDGVQKCILSVDESNIFFEAQRAPMKIGNSWWKDNYFNMDLIDIQFKQHGVVGNLQALSPSSFNYEIVWTSSAPSNQPSMVHSSSPSKAPSNQPNKAPTSTPTYFPSLAPSCPSGKISDENGYSSCIDCPIGGYCPTPDSFEKCAKGHYNNLQSQISETACKPCPLGAFCNTTETYTKCQPGTYNDIDSQTESTACKQCEKGTHQKEEGQFQCIPCHHMLSSFPGSKLCTVCGEGYYLTDFNARDDQIHDSPTTFCKKCPTGVDCNMNTNLNNMNLEEGYWRQSFNTSKIYKCETKATCQGSNTTSAIHRGDTNGHYCIENHTGPLCQVCKLENDYFSYSDEKCMNCPKSSSTLHILLIFIIGAMVLFLTIGTIGKLNLTKRFQRLDFTSSLGLRAKFKLLITFYQILATFKDIYGIELSPTFTKWMKFLTFNLEEILNFKIPMSCIGTTNQLLVLKATWPYLLIVLGAGCFRLANYARIYSSEHKFQKPEDRTKVKKQLIQLTIVVIYFALPVVAQSTFDAINCRAFQINDDEPPEFRSYLLSDMGIVCDINLDSKYRSIKIVFWVLFSIWIIITPLAFFALLKYISTSICSKQITFLAESCRFLWDDYDSKFWYWDVVDTIRKISLTGLIMFVQPKEGSNKFLRLILAIILSTIYSFILLGLRPYKRPNDYYCAFSGNLLLIICFCLGLILKLCDDDEKLENSSGARIDLECHRFIGFNSSMEATTVVTILAFGMLIVTALSIIVLAFNTKHMPKTILKSTGHAPNLELPEQCYYHVFVSHVWSTGQAKTHAIVRKMQLLLPGLKIWLDVDELHDISNLESSVEESVVFLLYYSKSYFRSRNCRREIYTAIRLNKPIIVVYEGGENTLRELREECMENCIGAIDIASPGSLAVLKKLFGNDDGELGFTTSKNPPILWKNENEYSHASLNLIFHRILQCLPYYANSTTKDLVDGIIVPGEIEEMILEEETNLLVLYEENEGCLEIAYELKRMGKTFSQFLNITNASKHHAQKASDKPSKSYLLFYLNKNTFNESYKAKVAQVVKACLDDPDIDIILIREMDKAKDASPNFSFFYKEAPMELISGDPYDLFKEIAIPLHSEEEYRIVALRQVARKMGAIAGKNKNKIMSITKFNTK